MSILIIMDVFPHRGCIVIRPHPPMSCYTVVPLQTIHKCAPAGIFEPANFTPDVQVAPAMASQFQQLSPRLPPTLLFKFLRGRIQRGVD